MIAMAAINPPKVRPGITHENPAGYTIKPENMRQSWPQGK